MEQIKRVQARSFVQSSFLFLAGFLLAGASSAYAGEAQGNVYVTGRLAFSADSLGGMKARGEGENVRLGSSTRKSLIFPSALGLGYHLAPGWRVEAELGGLADGKFDKSLRADGASGKLRVETETRWLMLNLYRDIAVTDKVSVYGGLGLGWARAKAEGYGEVPGIGTARLRSHTQNVLVGNVGLGASYALSPSWSLDLGYRYLYMGKVKTGGLAGVGGASADVRGNPRAHQISLGVRYRF